MSRHPGVPDAVRICRLGRKRRQADLSSTKRTGRYLTAANVAAALDASLFAVARSFEPIPALA
jgi:hypothetical protein